jgi:ubiquinone/menaquinone biosynthesis C-methylase UbiE
MNLLSFVRMIFSAYVKRRQRVVIQEIPPGRVLDIGGGGEGVIGQVGGARVVAVDRLGSEIHEARARGANATWVVADAAQLPLKGHSLDHATAFFSCMFMPEDVLREAFREVEHVLRDGGEFWIWDSKMGARGDAFAIRLRVDIEDRRTINTAYGGRAKEQSAATLAALLREANFETDVRIDTRHWFMIRAKKIS